MGIGAIMGMEQEGWRSSDDDDDDDDDDDEWVTWNDGKAAGMIIEWFEQWSVESNKAPWVLTWETGAVMMGKQWECNWQWNDGWCVEDSEKGLAR